MSRTLPLPSASTGVDFTVAIVGPTGAPEGSMTPNGFEQLSGLNPATALTVPAGSSYAIMTAGFGPVRWRADGVAPTDTIGTAIEDGASTTVYQPALATVQVFSTAGELSVAYFR